MLAGLLEEGGTVFFDESLPASVPGMFDLSEREQQMELLKGKDCFNKRVGNAATLLDSVGICSEKSLAGKGFHFFKMKYSHEDWYMIFNCSTESIDEWADLQAGGKSFVFYFPEDGKITLAGRKKNAVRIQLEPERAVFIRCTSANVDAPRHVYIENDAEEIEVKGTWKISFTEGGPVFPGDISTEVLKTWTEMGDAETRRFAGTARYSVEFEWNEDSSSGLLDLGEVKDCARVKLNGKDLGTLLGPAYRIGVNNLKQGNNLLEVEVTNKAANRIRDMDYRGVEWKRFYDINFVNINYETFDASGWEVAEAGLTTPVRITPQ